MIPSEALRIRKEAERIARDARRKNANDFAAAVTAHEALTNEEKQETL